MSERCTECLLSHGRHVHGCSLSTIDVSDEVLKGSSALVRRTYAACKSLEPSLRMYYCGNQIGITARFDGETYGLMGSAIAFTLEEFIRGCPLDKRREEIRVFVDLAPLSGGFHVPVKSFRIKLAEPIKATGHGGKDPTKPGFDLGGIEFGPTDEPKTYETCAEVVAAYGGKPLTFNELDSAERSLKARPVANWPTAPDPAPIQPGEAVWFTLVSELLDGTEVRSTRPGTAVEVIPAAGFAYVRGTDHKIHAVNLGRVRRYDGM